MSLKSYIHSLRSKPQKVRETIVLLFLGVIAVILFFAWTFIFRSTEGGTPRDITNTISSTLSKALNNPVYQNTFGSPGSVRKSEINTASGASGL